MNDPTSSPWAGLGARGTVLPPTTGADVFERDPIQRTVPAAATTAPTSPFTYWRPAGSADTPESQPAANKSDEEVAPMTIEKKPRARKAAKERRPRKTSAKNPQFQICTVLLSGDQTRDELLAAVSAKRAAFNSAIFNAKATKRIEFIEKTGKYCLTAAGQEWVTGGANLDAQRARSSRRAAKSVKAKPGATHRTRGVSRPRAAPSSSTSAVALVDTCPQVLSKPALRYGVFSDGSFHIAKNGVQIDVTTDEFRGMLRYLERMAETK